MPSVTKVSQMINANDENRVTLQSELDEDFATANDAIGSLIRKEQTGFMKQIERRRQEVRYSLWVAHIRQTLSMNCCKKKPYNTLAIPLLGEYRPLSSHFVPHREQHPPEH